METSSISALNNRYLNYSSYNDDFLAQQLLSNQALLNSNMNLTNDTVSFKGNKAEGSDKGGCTTGSIVTALGV